MACTSGSSPPAGRHCKALCSPSAASSPEPYSAERSCGSYRRRSPKPVCSTASNQARPTSWPEPRNSQSNNKHRKHAGRPPAYPRKEKIMTNHVPEATKPASGDYAWLGAEAGSVADLMYMLNTEDWYDAINSRFVSELLDDTLPESILKAYLIQDFKFYNNGMMARLIKLAPRQETKDMLAAQSQWFADNEATYFEHFLEAYHVSQEEYDATEPTPANKEYGAYLDSLSDKSWPELITAICCMEWLYLAWAKRTVDADVIQQVPAHKGWVDLHEGAHFRRWVGDLISLVNEYCSIDGPEAEVFRTIVHLERRFFDDSYPQE
nr:MAG TPA: Putative transcription activator [Bacteriophage sp.]DAR18211.1 MAG TPA: Putative transcription activator [Bacteriophage sp.]